MAVIAKVKGFDAYVKLKKIRYENYKVDGVQKKGLYFDPYVFFNAKASDSDVNHLFQLPTLSMDYDESKGFETQAYDYFKEQLGDDFIKDV